MAVYFYLLTKRSEINISFAIRPLSETEGESVKSILDYARIDYQRTPPSFVKTSQALFFPPAATWVCSVTLISERAPSETPKLSVDFLQRHRRVRVIRTETSDERRERETQRDSERRRRSHLFVIKVDIKVNFRHKPNQS